MTCPACGRENPADASFCAGCGTPLTRACPDCGRPAAADAVFCAGCGRRLVPPSTTTPPPAPEHIAEKARASRAALEGERKQVTVLFADVKGSMDLQEDLARRQNAGVHECQALVAQARALRAAGGANAREAISDVVAAAHRTIERVGAVAWLPFVAEEKAWLAEVARR